MARKCAFDMVNEYDDRIVLCVSGEEVLHGHSERNQMNDNVRKRKVKVAAGNYLFVKFFS